MNQEIEGKLRNILKKNHMIYTSDLDSTIKAIQELVCTTVPEEHEFKYMPTTIRQADIAFGFESCRTEILKKWGKL